MSGEATLVAPLATYRNERPYPFCPGCGHGPVLDQLDRALVASGIDPRLVVLVSDIGCSGLSDQYFDTSAFHGLHGRSITYATGLKLARPELTVIVLMGDGGAGIGGAHLLAAARRNLGIKVLVLDNLNFGMTGGQHSTTTPTGALTATTPLGNLEAPLDICATVAANGAAFVWRGTSFDPELAETLASALLRPGFALLDVWDLCTAYFLPRNRWSRRSLVESMETLGFARGTIRDEPVADYVDRYRDQARALAGQPVMPSSPLEPRFESTLEDRFRLVVAGSAGGRVGSASRLVARAAILAGLHAALRADYPVTVKSGHSIAELVLSPEPIEYAGIDQPDALAIVSEEGFVKAESYLSRMGPSGTVFVAAGLACPPGPAPVAKVDASTVPARLARSAPALVFLVAVIESLSLLPSSALYAAVALEPASRRGVLDEAVSAGLELAAASKGDRDGV